MRCYNGAPDEELQALLNHKGNMRKQLAEAIPGARAVYFPADLKPWQVWSDDHKPLSDEFFEMEDAIRDAIEKHKE